MAKAADQEPRALRPGRGLNVSLLLQDISHSEAARSQERQKYGHLLSAPRPRCHELHMDDFEPQSGDPLHEPGQGGRIREFGTEGRRGHAYRDLAIVEFGAQYGPAWPAKVISYVCDFTTTTPRSRLIRTGS